jgi:chromosome segregation ATPase
METEPVDEADLRTLVRAFRASVSEDQAAIHRQMSDLATEVRQRITTVETAMLNGLRDLGQWTDRRFTELERDVAEVRHEVAGVKQELAGVKEDVAGVEQELAGVKEDVAGVKEDVAGVRQDVAQLADGMKDLTLAVGRIEELLNR